MLFILEGVWAILTVGIDNRIANLVTGVLSAAAGVVIIAWPSPSLTVLGIFVGAMRIVYAFQLRRLPEDVDQAFADHSANGATGSSGSERYVPASPASSS